MRKLQLSLAMGDYDHVRDVLHGDVPVDGVDIVVAKRAPVEEIFHRFTRFREWDASEMSFGKYVALASQTDCDVVAIPVFPSRAFRHSSVYVRADSPLRALADLKDTRIGIPEWAQTASIYTRGLVAHDHGVPLTSVQWVQSGVNEAGRKEKVAFKLPDGVRYRSEPARSLNEMLLAGDIDAAFSARAPQAFVDGSGRLRRLLADPRADELAYWQTTGIFPIMHVLALRREVVQRDPWVAMNLLQAFEEAKRRSLLRMMDVTASPMPLPWIASHAAQARDVLGDDFWPYGIEANRATLEAFLGFAWEQGLLQRRLTPEALFVESTLSPVRI